MKYKNDNLLFLSVLLKVTQQIFSAPYPKLFFSDLKTINKTKIAFKKSNKEKYSLQNPSTNQN